MCECCIVLGFNFQDFSEPVMHIAWDFYFRFGMLIRQRSGGGHICCAMSAVIFMPLVPFPYKPPFERLVRIRRLPLESSFQVPRAASKYCSV